MQSVAAYYVLVASDIARQASARARTYDNPPRSTSRFAQLRNVFSGPTCQAAEAA